MEDSGDVHDRQIHELTEIYEERKGPERRSADGKNPQQVVMVDGRGYERGKTRAERVHNLTDIVDGGDLSNQLKEEVMKKAIEIVERIAKEMVPDIAERMIREEIEIIKAKAPDSIPERNEG
jgi:dihydroneopterin aldolase